ncbi:MAG TPA: zf-TFIIB domain-containing protein [Candidatus Dormibacteraeota bacterium]|nr:zf-TFIIB domain-containing protein [Candidatus Dormibacteraeota bacterium]
MTTNQVITEKNQITYNMCEKCGSLWLDAGMLDKMAFQVQGSIEYCEHGEKDEPESHPKKCPRCDDFTLSRVKFLESDDIHLHYCRNCGGFWLDAGELDRIDQNLAAIMPVTGKGFSDFVNNAHVPYWYKRIRKSSEETDFQVEVEPILGSKRVASTADLCPSCGNALALYELHSMKFEGCPKCKGIWLAKDELRTLKNTVVGASLRWLNDEIDTIEKASVISTQRLCVRCKTVNMVAVIFGKTKILIDWCPKCHGQWLDHGEFQAIVGYLKEEMSTMRPKQIEQEAARDLVHALKGDQEGRAAELLDAQSALAAMINAEIFQHPGLFNLCMRAAHMAP